MKNCKILYASLGFFILPALPSTAAAQFVGGKAVDQARQFAEKSLRDYVSGVVREENAPRFGFKDVAEANAARVAEPIPVLFIGLRELKAYRAGAGVGAVMNNSRTLWFPVLAQGEVRSKIEVGEIQNKWVAGEFGRPKAAQRLWRAYGELPKLLEAEQVKAAGRPALVRVRALGIELFYVSSAEGGDYFVLASSYSKIPDLPAKKVFQADALLVRLSQLAQPVREDVVR